MERGRSEWIYVASEWNKGVSEWNGFLQNEMTLPQNGMKWNAIVLKYGTITRHADLRSLN